MRLAKIYFDGVSSPLTKLCASQTDALDWIRLNGRGMNSFTIEEIETNDPVEFNSFDRAFLRDCGIECP
jgi:hypothetical protein